MALVCVLAFIAFARFSKAAIARIEVHCSPAYLFGPREGAGFLQPEGVHAEYETVARNLLIPFRQ